MTSTRVKLIEVLSSREYEILTILASGALYKEIAEKLHISIDTVKKHITTIYKKLEVRNKTEALLLLQAHLNDKITA